MSKSLSYVAKRLEALIEDHEASLSLMHETNARDVVMIGTKDGYLRAAKALVELVVARKRGRLKKHELLNTELHYGLDVEEVFDRKAHVVPDCACFVDRETDRHSVVDLLHRLFPQDSPEPLA